MSVNTRLSLYAHRGNTTVTLQGMLISNISSDGNSSYTSHHTWSPKQEPFSYTAGKLIKNTTVVKAFRYLVGGIGNLTSTLVAGSTNSTHRHNVNLQKRPTQFPTPKPSFRVPTPSPSTNQPTSSPTQPPSGTNAPSMGPANIPSASPITTSPTTPQPVTTPTEQPSTNSPSSLQPSQSPLTPNPTSSPTELTHNPTAQPSTQNPHTQNPITPSPSHQGETNTPSMSPSNIPSTSPTNSSSIDQQGGNHVEGSSALIAAIVGGTVGGAAVLATILYCLCKRSHRYSQVSAQLGGDSLLTAGGGDGGDGGDFALDPIGIDGNIQTPTATATGKAGSELSIGGDYQPVPKPPDEQPPVNPEDFKSTRAAATSQQRNDDGKGGSKRDSSVTQAVSPFSTLRKHPVEIDSPENKNSEDDPNGPNKTDETGNRDSRLSNVPAAGTPRRLLAGTFVTSVSDTPTVHLADDGQPLPKGGMGASVDTNIIPAKLPRFPNPSSLFGSTNRSSVGCNALEVNLSGDSNFFPDGSPKATNGRQKRNTGNPILDPFRVSVATANTEAKVNQALQNIAEDITSDSKSNDEEAGEENAEGKTPSNMSPRK